MPGMVLYIEIGAIELLEGEPDGCRLRTLGIGANRNGLDQGRACDSSDTG